MANLEAARHHLVEAVRSAASATDEAAESVQQAREAFANLQRLRAEERAEKAADAEGTQKKSAQIEAEHELLASLQDAASGVQHWQAAGRNLAMQAILKDLGGPAALRKARKANFGRTTPFISAVASSARVKAHTLLVLFRCVPRQERLSLLAPEELRGEETAMHHMLTTRSEFLHQVLRCLPRKCRSEALTLRNEFGDTPLHAAARHGRWQIAEVLLDRQKSLGEQRDGDGLTALQVAMRSHYQKVVVVLLRAQGELTLGAKAAAEEALLDGLMHDVPEALLYVAKHLPEVYSEHVVAHALEKVGSLGTEICIRLAPELKVNTEAALTWLPVLSLGEDPWLQRVVCKKQEGNWRSNEEPLPMLPRKRQEELEQGPSGLKTYCRPRHKGRRRQGGVPRVVCTANTVPAHLLLTTELVRGLAFARAQEALVTPFAQGALAKWWAEVETFYHVDMCLNMLHLLAAAAMTYGLRNGITETAWFSTAFCVACALLAKDLLHEICLAFQLQDWLVDERKLMDLLRVAVEVAALHLLQRVDEETVTAAQGATALWVALWWCHFLYELRGLRSIGPRLLPIFGAINSSDVRSLGFVLLFALAAACHAYYVFGVRGEPNQFYATLMTIYRLAVLGDFDLHEMEGKDVRFVASKAGWEPQDPEPSAHYVMVHVLFYCVSAGIAIVLMNLVIGVLGGSYDFSRDAAEEAFARTRAQLILEYKAATIPGLFRRAAAQEHEKHTTPSAEEGGDAPEKDEDADSVASDETEEVSFKALELEGKEPLEHMVVFAPAEKNAAQGSFHSLFKRETSSNMGKTDKAMKSLQEAVTSLKAEMEAMGKEAKHRHAETALELAAIKESLKQQHHALPGWGLA